MTLINALAVVIENGTEQPWIPTAPTVNRLLHIPNIKQTASPAVILKNLIKKVVQHSPLQITGVLKLVQQPVIQLTVQAIIDV